MSTHIPPTTEFPDDNYESHSKKGSVFVDVIFLIVLFAVIYLALTALRPLANPDEGRYTAIPREMLASGEWILPHLNGFLYFYKPPLVYWMEAGAIALFGDNLVGLRLVPAFFGILGIVATYLFARRIYGRMTGLLSAIVLGSCLVYAMLSQIILLDMGVAAFICAGLFAFFAALLEERSKAKRDWLFCAGMALTALALMCKGLIAIVIPGGILFFWILLLNQWYRLKGQAWIAGIITFLVIALPWHIAAWRSSEHWFDFYVIHEHFLRYTSDVSSRSEPFWFFFALFPVGLVPWVLFLPQAWADALRGAWRNRKERSVEWAMTIWIVFVLVFFSISKSKLIPYVLPIYPALAILVGRYLTLALREDRIGLRRGIWMYAGLGVGVAIAMPIVALVRAGHTAQGAWIWLTVMAIAGIIAALATAHYAYRHQTREALLAMIATQLLILFVLPPLAGKLQRPGTREVGEFLRPYLAPNEQVFTLYDYGIYQDFPFYIDRVVGLTSSVPTEQQFGYDWEDPEPKDRFLSREEIAFAWNGPKRIIMIGRNKDEGDKVGEFRRENPNLEIHVWKDDGMFQILSNRPLGEGADNVIELPQKVIGHPVIPAKPTANASPTNATNTTASQNAKPAATTAGNAAPAA